MRWKVKIQHDIYNVGQNPRSLGCYISVSTHSLILQSDKGQ